ASIKPLIRLREGGGSAPARAAASARSSRSPAWASAIVTTWRDCALPSIRILKTIVVGLGVVLVLGLGLLAYGVMLRVGEATRTRAPVAATAAWEVLKLAEPPGTRVGNVSQSGSTIVLHLYTGNPGTDERLVLIDAASGRVVGRIAVTEPQ